MYKLEGLNETDINDISKQIADAFFDYKYNKDDLGLIKCFMNSGKANEALYKNFEIGERR